MVMNGLLHIQSCILIVHTTGLRSSLVVKARNWSIIKNCNECVSRIFSKLSNSFGRQGHVQCSQRRARRCQQPVYPHAETLRAPFIPADSLRVPGHTHTVIVIVDVVECEVLQTLCKRVYSEERPEPVSKPAIFTKSQSKKQREVSKTRGK